MEYTKRHAAWHDKSTATDTPILAADLQAFDDALDKLLGKDTPAVDEVGVWTPGSGGLIYQKISNAQISAAAAIARSKLDFGSGLTNADIAAAAAIARSKLDFGSGLTNADIAAAAAIARAKLDFGSGLVNADIAAAAAIAQSKIAFDAWQTYVAVVTQGAGSIALVSQSSRYVQVGKTVTVRCEINVSGSGTGTNIIGVTLPVTQHASPSSHGSFMIFDNSASTHYTGTVFATGTTANFYRDTAGGMGLITLGANDIIRFTLTYEAA